MSNPHLGRIFFDRAGELNDRTFLKIQRGHAFEDVSWSDFARRVEDTIIGLYALGMSAGEHVALIGENSLPWLCADMATLAAGLPNVVISPRTSDAMLAKILRHSKARAVFVEDGAGAARVSALQGKLPGLSRCFIMHGAAPDIAGTISFSELLQQGQRSDRTRLAAILSSVRPDALATIMYTSGSTGEPKGVMRTHDNLLSNITNGNEIVLSKPEELTVLVLSVNHLFGRFGFLKSAVTGRTTAIIEATELDLDLPVIQALQPTGMSIVPRVMERLWNLILDQGHNREIWARIESLDPRSDGTPREELKENLRQGVLRAMGDRLKYISYGGAAMPPRILKFFEIVGVPLIGSYGSTECGGVTLCGIGHAQPGSLGKPFPNVELRLAEDGELLVRGSTVTPGYFEDPNATREAFDADGWFRTGDLATMDRDGALYIVGRKKDVFNCADGSNIYPGFIELLLENDVFIRQAILLGDHRPFIAALLVPDRGRIAATLNRPETALSDEEIEAALWQHVHAINAQLEHYEQIRQIAVMANDFAEEIRSATALHKIKINRQAVEERYREQINRIYFNVTQGAAA